MFGVSVGTGRDLSLLNNGRWGLTKSAKCSILLSIEWRICHRRTQYLIHRDEATTTKEAVMQMKLGI